jgi:hypothetical protein
MCERLPDENLFQQYEQGRYFLHEQVMKAFHTNTEGMKKGLSKDIFVLSF